MHRGYVKLWRLTLEKPLFQNAEVFQFAAWCLLKASHKARRQVVGKQIVDLQPGQFVTGRNKAAQELGSTPGKIRSCVQSLSNTGFLTSKTTNKFSIISVVNWEVYQPEEEKDDQQNGQQTANKRPTNDHKQELKELKEEKKIYKRKVARSFPSDFCLDDTMTAYAVKKGITIERLNDVFEHFKDHHTAKGSLMKDWKAAWRTWCQNDQKFGRPRAGPNREKTAWERSRDSALNQAKMLKAIREKEQREAYEREQHDNLRNSVNGNGPAKLITSNSS